MKRAFFHKAGRLHFIHYAGHIAISVGENGYARIEVRPTTATIRRLEALAGRGYGSRNTDTVGGFVYRSPRHFSAALWRTRKMMIRMKWEGFKYRWGRKRA